MKNKYVFGLLNALIVVVLYLILSECFTYLFLETKLFDRASDMKLQNIVVVLSFLPIAYMRRYEIMQKNTTEMEQKGNKLIRIGLVLVCILIFGIAWNNLILSFPFAKESLSYRQVNEALLGGSSIPLTLLRTCILAPIVEEILYRKLVYQRLKLVYGARIAIIASAFIFGLVHMNLVQGIYATGIGLFLAYIYEKEKDLRIPIVFHAALNLIAVIRTETKCFSIWEESKIYQISSIFLAVISAIIILYIYKAKKKE